eukprot:PDM84711.1 hypothetical protein PRIPAC_33734 [Pristionchus pacificus]
MRHSNAYCVTYRPTAEISLNSGKDDFAKSVRPMKKILENEAISEYFAHFVEKWSVAARWFAVVPPKSGGTCSIDKGTFAATSVIDNATDIISCGSIHKNMPHALHDSMPMLVCVMTARQMRQWNV